MIKQLMDNEHRRVISQLMIKKKCVGLDGEMRSYAFVLIASLSLDSFMFPQSKISHEHTNKSASIPI